MIEFWFQAIEPLLSHLHSFNLHLTRQRVKYEYEIGLFICLSRTEMHIAGRCAPNSTDFGDQTEHKRK